MSETSTATEPKKSDINQDEVVTTEVAKTNDPGHGSAIAKVDASSNVFYVMDPTSTEFPDLENLEVAPLELASEYYKPEYDGETLRIVFVGIEDSMMPSRADKNVIVAVPTVFFYGLNKEKAITKFRNGSKLLVSAFQDFKPVYGMGFILTYVGKKEFKNGNTGDEWSVKPLLKKKAEPKSE